MTMCSKYTSGNVDGTSKRLGITSTTLRLLHCAILGRAIRPSNGHGTWTSIIFRIFQLGRPWISKKTHWCTQGGLSHYLGHISMLVGVSSLKNHQIPWNLSKLSHKMPLRPRIGWFYCGRNPAPVGWWLIPFQTHDLYGFIVTNSFQLVQDFATIHSMMV